MWCGVVLDGVASTALCAHPFFPARCTAKGGFEVTASYNGETRSVDSPVTVTASFVVDAAASSNCTILAPWPPASTAVTCGGAVVPVQVFSVVEGDAAVPALSFTAPRAVACTLTRTTISSGSAVDTDAYGWR